MEQGHICNNQIKMVKMPTRMDIFPKIQEYHIHKTHFKAYPNRDIRIYITKNNATKKYQEQIKRIGRRRKGKRGGNC